MYSHTHESLIHTHILTHTYTNILIHTYSQIHKHIHKYTNILTHIYILTQTQTHTYTYTLSHKNIYSHTHIHLQNTCNASTFPLSLYSFSPLFLFPLSSLPSGILAIQSGPWSSGVHNLLRGLGAKSQSDHLEVLMWPQVEGGTSARQHLMFLQTVVGNSEKAYFKVTADPYCYLEARVEL